MVPVKKTSKKAYVHAYSILEVIVSTIIILIVFLLFTTLIAQLLNSRMFVQETQLLLKTNSIHFRDGSVDTIAVKAIFPEKKVLVSDSINDPFSTQIIQIFNENAPKPDFRFYSMKQNQQNTTIFQK